MLHFTYTYFNKVIAFFFLKKGVYLLMSALLHILSQVSTFRLN